MLRTDASWRCSRRCSSCRRRRNRQTWRQQLPSYVTKDGLFCCSSSACNPYDMLTSRKSYIAHSLTTHLQQCSPVVLGLTDSLSLVLETSLFVCGPSNAEVALCLTLWRQGVINASCFCPPLGSISVLRPGATSAYYTYSPIFGGLPQAQRGKRNVRGVKFLSRKSSRNKFQFHQR